ncbi:MAG: hypothetical protein ABJQ69_03520 [Ekhidna sp.]
MKALIIIFTFMRMITFVDGFPHKSSIEQSAIQSITCSQDGDDKRHSVHFSPIPFQSVYALSFTRNIELSEQLRHIELTTYTQEIRPNGIYSLSSGMNSQGVTKNNSTMSIVAGYQSDTNLENLRFIGNLPIENSLGGFGITSGDDDNYQLLLDPPLTTYRLGLALNVKFNHINEGQSTISVNQLAAIPLKKLVDGQLENLEAEDIDQTSLYTLKFDGDYFQVDLPTVTEIPEASNQQQGVIQIASQEVVDLGEDNKQAVTAKTLFEFVSDKVTGLWEDKGLINATNPIPFPSGERGDAYTIIVDEALSNGVIGNSNGQPGVAVKNRDVLYCIKDNPGGTALEVGSDWNVIRARVLNQASELIAGIAKIATGELVDQGTDNATIVSPLGLENRLNKYVNHQEILFIEPRQINPQIRHTPGRNRYTAINGNLIVTRDIRLVSNEPTPAQVNGHMLNFPKPLEPSASFSHPILSSRGNLFFISIDKEGRLEIRGTFEDNGEEILLNVNPYLALFPLQYDRTPTEWLTQG